jgi:hypothetical protein
VLPACLFCLYFVRRDGDAFGTLRQGAVAAPVQSCEACSMLLLGFELQPHVRPTGRTAVPVKA